MDEKSNKNSILPSQASISQNSSPKPRKSWTKFKLLLLVFLTANYALWTRVGLPLFNLLGGKDHENVCPQVLELAPKENAKLWQDLIETFKTPEFKALAIDWLGGAVRVP